MSGAVQAPAAPSGLLAWLRGKDDFAVVTTLALATVASGLFFVLQPRLGVSDGDGYAYIMGARNLRAGLGYRGLMGDPFNHWPPGYSILLSLFSDQLVGAWIINGLFYGAAVGLLYLLTRRAGWTWQAGLGLSVGMGAGFLRLVAACVHADIMTYAAFLGALVICLARPSRIAPAAIWAALVPVKFIAVAFLPPAALADLVADPKAFWRLVLRYLPAAALVALTTGALIAYNLSTIGTWMADSHAQPTLKDLEAGVVAFAVSIPRELLFSWYGSLGGLVPKIAFGLTLLTLAVCALAAKPMVQGRWLRIYGLGFLACCVVLLCVRSFDPSARLSAYGVIAFMVGFQPLRWANWTWLFYAALSLAVAGYGLATQNNLGANDPRYARLAAEVGAYDHSASVIASNSFHILDLHANLPSVPVASWGEAAPEKELLWVTLPNYDAIATAVTPLPAPPAGWVRVQAFDGGALYRRTPSRLTRASSARRLDNQPARGGRVALTRRTFP